MDNGENVNNEVIAEAAAPDNEEGCEFFEQESAGSDEPKITTSAQYTDIFDLSVWCGLLFFGKHD